MTELSEAPAPVEEEQADGTSRRVAVLAVAGAVVLALLAWLLLGRGGDDTALTVVPSAKKAVRPPAAGPAAKPAVKLPPQSNATLGRDPFKALVTEPVAEPVPAPDAGGGGAGGVANPTLPGTGGQVVKPGPTKAPQPTTYALRLSRVDGTGSNLTARFLLGEKGTVQYARVGSRFGRTAEIKLLSLQSDGNGKGTAVIQVGESPFDLSTGDPAIYVQ